MTTIPNWKIYIVAHKNLFPQMYENDSLFSTEHFSVLNVGANELIDNAEGFEVINQYELPNAIKQGKHWAESEGMYNLWRSGEYKSLDYIGFIHYDIELRLEPLKYRGHKLPEFRKTTNITRRIEKALNRSKNNILGDKKACYLGFKVYDTWVEYGARIQADVNDPETLVGDGYNCYDYIFDDYNEYFQTKFTKDDFIAKKRIGLCSCFLIDTYHFDEMMKFWDWVVQKGDINKLDTLHRHRLQGGLAERYFGVYLMNHYDECKEIQLIHHFNEGLK